MFEIDMKSLSPVGEFGSLAWCEACAHYGVQMLRAQRLPDDLAWGFSEVYTDPPARLLDGGRALSGYHFMVKDGRVSGGDGVPDECTALPGFHVAMPWGFLCNQSRSLYGRAGQRQRSQDEAALLKAMSEALGRENPLRLARRRDAVWPPAVAEALSVGAEEGAGLHNIAATLQTPSPEFEGMPVTELGVPIFGDMTDAQRQTFVRLCGVKD